MKRFTSLLGVVALACLAAGCSDNTGPMTDTGTNTQGGRVYYPEANRTDPTQPAVVNQPAPAPSSNDSSGRTYQAGDRVYTNNPGTPVRP